MYTYTVTIGRNYGTIALTVGQSELIVNSFHGTVIE